MSTEGRTPRADARRNRERVIQAADEVFSAKGVSASTEEIARQAGVGIGTVFRHFPTKEALLEAVLLEHLRRVTDEARGLADAASPATALFAFITRFVGQSGMKNAVIEELTTAGVDVSDAVAEISRNLRDALTTLLRRAQHAGAVRDDIGAQELIALMVGAARAADYAGQDHALRARTIAIFLDGLRPRRTR